MDVMKDDGTLLGVREEDAGGIRVLMRFLNGAEEREARKY